MGPITTDARWSPGYGFSVFTFGAPIEPLVAAHFVWLHDRQPDNALSQRFDCEELECEVWTVDGVIHQVRCPLVCCLNGYNLIGTERQQIVDLLAPAEVSFEPDEPVSEEYPAVVWIVRCPELGFVGDMPVATNMLYCVDLFGSDIAHRRREAKLHGWLNDNDRLKPSLSLIGQDR
jgi:hypothetical protein